MEPKLNDFIIAHTSVEQRRSVTHKRKPGVRRNFVIFLDAGGKKVRYCVHAANVYAAVYWALNAIRSSIFDYSYCGWHRVYVQKEGSKNFVLRGTDRTYDKSFYITIHPI